MATLDTAKLWGRRLFLIAYGLFVGLAALGAVSPTGSGNVPLALLLAFTSGGIFTFTVLTW